jgi:transcriptional regulator with PAS, ATPase and Fis domain
MKKILICWIGLTDLKAAGHVDANIGAGPICQAVSELGFDKIHLISDRPEAESKSYTHWLKSKITPEITLHKKPLSSPTNFGEIYESVVDVLDTIKKQNANEKIAFTFHLSPGTPAMAAVWIIIAKTQYSAALIESSIKKGVNAVSIPFNISAEFIPDLLKKSDLRLEQLTAGLPPDSPGFESIIHRSPTMKSVISKARYVALRSVPVLIEGESGTGKELFAHAIHESSPRNKKPFIAVNCGAIPSELLESELFGYEKGAFTGAIKQKQGYFEAAHQGTLFLDEIGELPLHAQVKLLRVLQEKEVVRIGATGAKKIDVRIIAATNKTLINEINDGKFRSDLFYRLAVAVLKLPPLRERQGDVGLLIDHILDQMDKEGFHDPYIKHKKISADAKNFMIQYDWPGNIRELQNTLMRAAIWTPDAVIAIDDIRDAVIPVESETSDRLLNRSVANGINLPDLMAQLARHYLKKGLDASNGNKTKASELLGLSNYQTLSNWLKKYNMD